MSSTTIAFIFDYTDIVTALRRLTCLTLTLATPASLRLSAHILRSRARRFQAQVHAFPPDLALPPPLRRNACS